MFLLTRLCISELLARRLGMGWVEHGKARYGYDTPWRLWLGWLLPNGWLAWNKLLGVGRGVIHAQMSYFVFLFAMGFTSSVVHI